MRVQRDSKDRWAVSGYGTNSAAGDTAQAVTPNNTALPGGAGAAHVLPGKATASAPTYSEGASAFLSFDLAGNLRISGGSGGTSATDQAGWTAGSSSFTPIGGVRDDTAPSTLAEGQQGTVRLTVNRAAHIAQPGAPNFVTGQVALSTVAGLIAASRVTRRQITIVNMSTTVIYLGASGVVTGDGLYLAGVAGAAVTLDVTGAVYGIVAAGTPSVSFIEEYD